MTLIVTLVAKDRIVQVSDRRLTNIATGERREGNNKAVCVGIDNIHFATAYTGLAHIGRPRTDDRTDYWLLENLGSITSDGEPSVESICTSLGRRATDTLSQLRCTQNIKGLKFVLTGYDRENRPFRASVSNIKFRSHDIYEVQDSFRASVHRYYPWSPMPDIDVAGTVGAFEAKDMYAKTLRKVRATVVRHLRKHGDKFTEEQIARILVSLVRAANQHKKFGYGIGRDCLSVAAFRREPSRRTLFTHTIVSPANFCKDALFTAFYHPERASTLHHAPHLADPYCDYMNVEMDEDPELPDEARAEDGTSLASRTRVRVRKLPEPGEDVTLFGIGGS